MATRKIRFVGYNDEPTTATFDFNGTQVFSGTIPVTGTESAPGTLFEFDIDQALSGDIASNLTVSSGGITFVTLSANHSTRVMPAVILDGIGGVKEDMPANTADDVTNTFTWFNDGFGHGAVKTNVQIDDVSYDRSDVSGDAGAGHINVISGSSMTCNITTVATPVVVA